MTVVTTVNFNPRIPYGMRRHNFSNVCNLRIFQSTHPVWDATAAEKAGTESQSISIHASRMGCDRSHQSLQNQAHHFNPRIPYGMRPSVYGLSLVCGGFQSTHPVWDATLFRLDTMRLESDFNPRIPYGMRRGR